MRYRMRMNLIAAALAVLMAGALAASPACAGQGRTMIGSITDINSKYETVVVEVPMGGEKFTVAGPVHEQAVLERNDRPVRLDQFHSGDKVTVRWHTTESGHVIDGLVYPAGR